MKFRAIFLYELRYLLGRVPTWIYAAGLAAFMVLLTGLLLPEEATAGPDGRLANAPARLANGMAILSLFTVVITAGLFGNAAGRDGETRILTLFSTCSVREREYLGGRFLGALAVNVIVLLIVPLGLALGDVVFRQKGLYGPFRWDAIWQPFFVIMLPNVFMAGSIVFALAAVARRPFVAYAGAILLFLGSLVAVTGFAEQLAYRRLATLLDPFGYTPLERMIEYWTPAERNTLLVPFEGLLLWNRLGWFAVALIALALLAWRYRFAHELGRGRAPRAIAETEEHPVSIAVPDAPRTFDAAIRVRQLLNVTRRGLGDLLRRLDVRVAAIAMLAYVFITGQGAGTVVDTPAWPTTYTLVRGVIIEVMPILFLLAAFYAGELIWKERDNRSAEIVDAAPVPNWVTLAGKFGALTLALALMLALLMAGCIALQTMSGYTRYQLDLYVKMLFGLQLADCVLWMALAMLIHVIVDHKYVGHFLVALYFAFANIGGELFPVLRVENKLLLYPAAPRWLHSDISGFEPFLAPWLAFRVYWAAWAVLFAVITHLLFVRGRDTGVRQRLRHAMQRMTAPARVAAVAAAALIGGTAAFIYWNTHVLNDAPDTSLEDWNIAYEKRYAKYEDLPQPQIARVDIRVDIDPDRRKVDVRGAYVLKNATGSPIGAIHVASHPDVVPGRLSFDRAARRTHYGERHRYSIYELAQPLRPGETTRLEFDFHHRRRGFPLGRPNAAVVSNGTYFDNNWMPLIGFQNGLREGDGRVRAKHGLPPLPPLPPIDDAKGRRHSLGERSAEWIDFSAIVSTSAGQVVLAPGSLRRTWTENPSAGSGRAGRRYFHFTSDVPMRNVYTIHSGRFAVRKERWRDVDIEIAYHPEHGYNIERFLRGARATLDYHTRHFGPYARRALRIVEIPRIHGRYARALPGMVAHTENFGFVARPDHGIDYPLQVTAHEVAHQWWGEQLAAARVEGGPVLHEGLATYASVMVLEQATGAESANRYRRLLLHRYLAGRQDHRSDEVPLLRSTDHSYLHYHKAGMAFYALSDMIGEARVNGAIRRVLERFRFKGAPYATTRDLYAELRAATPPEHRAFLADLFEHITLWDVRTHSARVEGNRVTLEVEARKLESDKPVPMNDLVDIGVFSASGEPLYLRKHRIRSGRQTITLTVPGAPASAGIDPNHKLIEMEIEDNVAEVL